MINSGSNLSLGAAFLQNDDFLAVLVEKIRLERHRNHFLTDDVHGEMKTLDRIADFAAGNLKNGKMVRITVFLSY